MAFVNNLLGKYLSFFYKKAAGPNLPCSGVSDLAIGNFLPDKKAPASLPYRAEKRVLIVQGRTPAQASCSSPRLAALR